MTRKEIRAAIKEAKAIAHDSWSLLHFEALPKNATPFEMGSALRKDRRWIEDHCNEVCKRIDRLCYEVEYGKLADLPKEARDG